MSWGPLIHGHAPRGLVKALAAAARDGTSFGAPSPLEVELGERVRALMPSIERVRFVSSGTEAAMSAVRVARAATGRDRIIKFEGCYHGHADAVSGQGRLRRADARHADQPRRHARGRRPTRWSPSYNDLGVGAAAVRRQPRSRSPRVIVEPIAGNMGVVPPADGFLRGAARHVHRRTARC